jgi:predicted hotdog family 3-hydroxylacyl-ACP dehydratase
MSDAARTLAAVDAFGAHPMDAWLPHRGRMRLIDRVERCDDTTIACTATVRQDGLFTGTDGMPAWIGIELMAQAAAAWAGARARADGGAPRVGFLVGARRYEAHVPMFTIGAELNVTAVCALAGANGMCLFDCTIVHAGRELASGRIGVYETLPGPEGD